MLIAEFGDFEIAFSAAFKKISISQNLKISNQTVITDIFENVGAGFSDFEIAFGAAFKEIPKSQNQQSDGDFGLLQITKSRNHKISNQIRHEIL